MDPKRDESSARARSSLDTIVELYERDVDATLIQRNLTLTVEQRFEQAMKLQEFAEELRRAGEEIRNRRT